MNHKQFKRHSIAFACILFLNSAQAEQSTFVPILESVLVTGKAEKADSITKPFSIVQPKEFNTNGASTLGETLRYQQGMSATGFGPNASRPIVRGQDADRIKILRNSASTVDVSALSFDHAVPVDPFSLHQIEILRGPAALAYGGNAIGGAVNLVDQRIARKPIEGLQGEVNLLGGGAADQTATGFKLDAGLKHGISVHLDGFKRAASDLDTPTFVNPNNISGNQVQNSSSKSDGAAIGTSIKTNNGYVGISAERYNSNYGVPKSLDVRIDMENERYAIEGEENLAYATFKSVKYRVGRTDYQHQEFEDNNPATSFRNNGLDGRLEIGLHPFELANYSINTQTGIQFEHTDFSAIGDEAFVPSTKTRQTGLFAIFNIANPLENRGVFELGLRTDHVKVDASSTGESPVIGPVLGAGVSNGPASGREFSPKSISLGYTRPLVGSWFVGGSLSQVERAPSSFELYADGVHVATDAYEKGNPNLQEERGRHIELTSVWAQNKSKFNATVFASRYNNYITLTGRNGADAQFNNGGELVNVFDFIPVPAKFQGLELSYQTKYTIKTGQLKPTIQYDLVRGKRTDGGGNLARISPQRVVASTEYAWQGWALTPELIWVDKSKPSSGDTQVNSHQLVNFRVSKAFSLSNSGGEVFANFQNLTNELAFSATTLNTVREYTPLAGRSALLGIKLIF